MSTRNINNSLCNADTSVFNNTASSLNATNNSAASTTASSTTRSSAYLGPNTTNSNSALMNSFNTWKRINPGFIETPKSAMKSTNQATYVYNPEHLEPVDWRHHRKSDRDTEFVEASVRYKLLAGANVPKESAAPAATENGKGKRVK